MSQTRYASEIAVTFFKRLRIRRFDERPLRNAPSATALSVNKGMTLFRNDGARATFFNANKTASSSPSLL